jgi:hypothetical protein
MLKNFAVTLGGRMQAPNCRHMMYIPEASTSVKRRVNTRKHLGLHRLSTLRFAACILVDIQSCTVFLSDIRLGLSLAFHLNPLLSTPCISRLLGPGSRT